MAIVLLGISFITFSLIYMAPGDPVRAMYSSSGIMPSEEVLNQTREAMGLNKPFLVQYFDWLTSCLQGDFGTSYSSGKPVLGILMDRLIPTLKLAFLSLIIMLVIAVPSGIIAAIKQNKFADYLIRGITFLGISMPNFWVGLLLLYVVALKLNLLPVISIGGGFKTMILPAVTLAFAMAAKYTRQVRTAVLEELNKDYVIGAKARGLSDGKILLRHVFPNSLLPLITLLGLFIYVKGYKLRGEYQEKIMEELNKKLLIKFIAGSHR